MAEIEVHDVSMSYGDTRVLTQLSLKVDDGSFYAMVGPSGSGKTTILKIIAGFVAPDAGVVRIAGADATGIRRSVATSGSSSRTTRCSPT